MYVYFFREKGYSGNMEHLVIGGEWAALFRYHKLFSDWGAEQVGLLVPRLLKREDILLRRVRGNTALVYKDMVFHPLVETMVKSQWERYFLTHSETESCFWEDEHFMEKLLLSQREGTPVEITGDGSVGYIVNCDNDLSVSCRHLHWMADPREFVQCYTGKISPSPVDNVPDTLYVRYSFEGVLTDMTETLLFPLSYAHSHGHFIGGFQTVREERQEVEFVTFLDRDESSEEDVSKKIRILDRRLTKAFVHFKKIPYKKSIRLDSYFPLPRSGMEDTSSSEGVHFL